MVWIRLKGIGLDSLGIFVCYHKMEWVPAESFICDAKII